LNGNVRAGAVQSFVPHLVLYRDGVLNPDPDESALIVEVENITVPLSGVTVTLEIKTQHQDPDQGGAPAGAPQIPVWDEPRWISNTWGVTRTDYITAFVVQFGETAISGTTAISTPTDYFLYNVYVGNPFVPVIGPEDYAFLVQKRVDSTDRPSNGSSAAGVGRSPG